MNIVYFPGDDLFTLTNAYIWPAYRQPDEPMVGQHLLELVLTISWNRRVRGSGYIRFVDDFALQAGKRTTHGKRTSPLTVGCALLVHPDKTQIYPVELAFLSGLSVYPTTAAGAEAEHPAVPAFPPEEAPATQSGQLSPDSLELVALNSWLGHIRSTKSKRLNIRYFGIFEGMG